MCDLLPHKMPPSSGVPRNMPYVELLVASPAGKPVFSFSHGYVPGVSTRYARDIAMGEAGSTRESFTRPLAQGLSLCAASVAFSAVAPDVRCIRSPAGVIFFASTHSLHVTAAAADPAFPTPVLASLARLSVAFLAAVLSANLMHTLQTRPSFDISPHLAPSTPHLNKLLSRALVHPLAYSSVAAPLLPCPTTPASRSALGAILTSAVMGSPSCVTHALLMTASPPFPRKVITVAAPSTHSLSPLDLLILSSLVPELQPDKTHDSSESEPVSMPHRVFLQSTAHSVPYVLSSAPVELRLQADDYEAFEAAVGGRAWRPEWDASGGDVVSVLVLAKASTSTYAQCAADDCVRTICASLSESRASRDLIVAMERPWLVRDIGGLREDSVLHDAVKGIIVFSASGDRMVATVGASDHELGMSFTRALGNSGWAADSAGAERMSRRGSNEVRRKKIWRAVDEAHGVRIIGFERRVLIAVDFAMPEADAERMFTDVVLPWEKRYHMSLCSEFDRVALPVRTMFGHLLAPFPES